MDSRDRRIAQLEREIRRLRAQARRDFEEIDWLECQVRVYRRLSERLIRQLDDIPPREDSP